jgi:hypothetical protein
MKRGVVDVGVGGVYRVVVGGSVWLMPGEALVSAARDWLQKVHGGDAPDVERVVEAKVEVEEPVKTETLEGGTPAVLKNRRRRLSRGK